MVDKAGGPATASAAVTDDARAGADEPRLDRRTGTPLNPFDTDGLWCRLELAFGYVSLLADPDLAEGFGGGLYFALGPHPRFGAELSFFVGQNDFIGEFGTIQASAFLAGNLSLGPVVRLTPVRWPVSATAELGLGFYAIKDQLRQDVVLTLGISGGFTVAYHALPWLGIGFKIRYHLFNLANVAGDPLIDVSSLGEVGVIDRFDLPVYVAFYF